MQLFALVWCVLTGVVWGVSACELTGQRVTCTCEEVLMSPEIVLRVSEHQELVMDVREGEYCDQDRLAQIL